MALDQDIELRKWIQAKAKIVQEWGDKTTQLLSAFAGRGFSRPPGVMVGALSDLGLAAKRGLAEASIKVLAESVEIGLGDTEHANLILASNTRLTTEAQIDALTRAFELERETLLNFYALQQEDLERILIELDRRETILIDGRAAIEDGMADLEIQLVEARRIPLEKEGILVQARMDTAKVKLLAIPLLQDLIEEERRLIADKQITLRQRQLLPPQQIALANAILDAEEAGQDTLRARRGLIPGQMDLIQTEDNTLKERENTLDNRTELVSLQGELVEQQENVSRAQIVTTAARLKVIEATRKVVEKETRLIDIERGNLTLEEKRLDAEKGLISSKSDLQKALEALQKKQASLTEAKKESAKTEQKMLEFQRDKGEVLREKKLEIEQDLSDAEIEEIFDRQAEIIDARSALSEARTGNQIALAEQSAALTEDLSNVRAEGQRTIGGIKQNIAFVSRESRKSVESTEISTTSETTKIDVDSSKDTIDKIGYYQRKTTTMEAIIRSMSEVTANVVQTILR